MDTDVDPETGGDLAAHPALGELLGRCIEDHRQAERRRVELQRLNDQLAEQAGFLAEANGRLEAFASSVTHDLNQPLVVLGGFLDLLVETRASAFDADAEAWLRAAHKAAHSLRDAMGALQANAGATPPELTEVDLHDVFAEARAELAGELAEAGGRISVEPLPAVMGDRAMLVRVVVNLMRNACRYRDETRPLVIRVRHRARTDDHVVIEIADNGRGLAPTELDAVFAPGHRGSASAGCPGTGTGLAIVRSVMTHLGGQVWAEGEPAIGARICLAIRATAPDRMQLAATRTRS